TYLPSVIADEEAYVPFSGCEPSLGTHSRAVRSQTTLPVLRSSATTRNLCVCRGFLPPCGACTSAPVAAAGTAVSKNTRSPQTIGDADPRPGISVFHRTFFVSLHSTGGSAVFDTPVAWGPRHWGQYFSAAVSGAACATVSKQTANVASVACVIRPPLAAV